MSLARVFTGVVGGGFVAGAALGAYGLWEARQYGLRTETVPVLPTGSPDIRVLHVSDIHLVPSQARKLEWLADLASLEPDLVVDTGDNLAHRLSVPPLLEAFSGLLGRPGVFVHGSNDYFEPRLRNPVKYLLPDDGKRRTNVPRLPWRDLSARFTAAGWTDLTNTRARLRVKGLDIAVAGVDDPHLGYDRLDAVAGPAPADADLRLAITHAPYLRVLDRFAEDGYDAILAGHTHGGQVCLPRLRGGGRALTTNCDLDPARARGLHHHRDAWLHVSAGLGSSPYTRVRVACRPEATLLTLTARPDVRAD